MARPVLYVLAGVNGAGKSSIGGHLLQRAGLTWFNPDTFARALIAATGCDQHAANAQAWTEGLRLLDDAIAARHSYAFETTLGGRTMPARILAAAATHDVLVWYCGLASPDLHVARVQSRVAMGGHDIPEATIRARWSASLRNLIALMPHLAALQVYDNSGEAAIGNAVPDPVLVLHVDKGRVLRPRPGDTVVLGRTPGWAKPIVEAALSATD